MKPEEFTHDQLAHDLAMHLRAGGERYVWENMPIGVGGSARPDVFAFKPFLFSKPEIISYEIKVSQSDLRSDLTSGKWQSYLRYSEGVMFAVPQGLCTKNDIPDGCGLMIRSERAWRCVRKPVLQRCTWSREVCLKLVSNAHRVSWKTGRLNDWERRSISEDCRRRAMNAAGKKFGKDLAIYLKRPEYYENMIENAKGDAESIIQHAKSERAKVIEDLHGLAKSLGVELEEDNLLMFGFRIRDRIREIADGPEGMLLRSINQAFNALQKGKQMYELAKESEDGKEQ